MKFLGKADIAEVFSTYRCDHPGDSAHEADSYRDGVENLQRAADLPGGWSRVLLSRIEILAVVLPWHLSEGGARELVPRTGLTVGQAAIVLQSEWSRWLDANPVCTKRLQLLSDAPFTPVFVSTSPVAHSDYADLTVREGLFHVDGLHRMIAWELAGRLPEDEQTPAFVAGDAMAVARRAGVRP
jgi:hypothetical protein